MCGGECKVGRERSQRLRFSGAGERKGNVLRWSQPESAPEAAVALDLVDTPGTRTLGLAWGGACGGTSADMYLYRMH